jgi:peptidylprolyl isomerase
MSRISAGLAALVALAAVAGCGKKEKVESETPAAEAEAAASEPAAPAEVAAQAAPVAIDPKTAAENQAAGEKFLAEVAARPGVGRLDDGLFFEVLKEGPAGGAAPGDADLVDIDFVGTKIDGQEFQSSSKQGAAAHFAVSDVAGSWTEIGLKAMTVGDRYRFFVPPKLAFGEQGTPGGPIGPNETLIFEVELLKVTNAEANLKASEAFLAENGKKSGIKTTASGLQYEVVSEGPAGGARPTDADIVKVHYRGALIDGTEFDSSYARNEPAEFPLGRVIAGWTEGVQLMKVGDKFRFYVPPQLGYGQSGTPGGPIGPNEALIFDVELIEVK